MAKKKKKAVGKKAGKKTGGKQRSHSADFDAALAAQEEVFKKTGAGGSNTPPPNGEYECLLVDAMDPDDKSADKPLIMKVKGDHVMLKQWIDLEITEPGDCQGLRYRHYLTSSNKFGFVSEWKAFAAALPGVEEIPDDLIELARVVSAGASSGVAGYRLRFKSREKDGFTNTNITVLEGLEME